MTSLVLSAILSFLLIYTVTTGENPLRQYIAYTYAGGDTRSDRYKAAIDQNEFTQQITLHALLSR
jgi:hypothetical protein